MLIVANTHLRALLAKLESDEGAGIVEYVLLIVAIALVVLLGIAVFAGGLNTIFGDIGTELEGVDVSIP